MNETITLKSVTQAHQIFGLEKPNHPLISVFQNTPNMITDFVGVRFVTEMYFVSMKDGVMGTFQYGRNSYDFQEGMMTFVAPGQTMGKPSGEVPEEVDNTGWTVLFHPDLIRKSELGRNIDRYTFFGYDVFEALYLSDKEKQALTGLAQKIEAELAQNIDRHTQKLVISTLELLLDYCTRYYDRQFYTRSDLHIDVVTQFEGFLKDYFQTSTQLEYGLPSVKYCSEQLHMSPNYLSDLLKKETGRNAQDHIHAFVINKAKTMLLNSTDSVTKVAFDLGFDYSQHFSRLFKSKTGMSPKEYRNLN